MNAEEISKLNEANFILRHFVNLSARLLPFLEELQRKENPTLEEIQSKKKIINVFENYAFDTRTSEMLIDSNILELIKTSFCDLSQENSKIYANRARGSLRKFLREYKRLSETWFLTSSN